MLYVKENIFQTKGDYNMNMANKITGLHHVTAIASDAQKNVDFYAGILGLRMVKKTVNFDAPDIYHLYYGNEDGSPGTIMTFFIYPDNFQGRKGKGQLTVTSFSIPANSLSYWMKRLDKFNIPYTKPPGFAVDEEPQHLGEGLKLPPWEEVNRTKIEKGLATISLNIEKFKD